MKHVKFSFKSTCPFLLALLLLSAPAAVQAQSRAGDGFEYTLNADINCISPGVAAIR